MTAIVTIKGAKRDYVIPLTLFCSYARIKMKQAERLSGSPEDYILLDKEARTHHDTILVAAMTDRHDQDFAFMLAREIEEVILP